MTGERRLPRSPPGGGPQLVSLKLSLSCLFAKRGPLIGGRQSQRSCQGPIILESVVLNFSRTTSLTLLKKASLGRKLKATILQLVTVEGIECHIADVSASLTERFVNEGVVILGMFCHAKEPVCQNRLQTLECTSDAIILVNAIRFVV